MDGYFNWACGVAEGKYGNVYHSLLGLLVVLSPVLLPMYYGHYLLSVIGEKVYNWVNE